MRTLNTAYSPFEGHWGRKRIHNWAGNRCGNDRKGRMVRCKEIGPKMGD
jgi:hypothetical protein